MGREPGRLASLPTVSVLVVCPALPPALPSLCLSSEPCPLDPEQAGPGTHGPILSASCAQMPPLLCSWGCWPCLAQLPRWPAPALAHTEHPCSGVSGPGWARPPYPWSLVPVHLQQRHSRPTTRSSKSTRPPPHPAQPPAPEVSAGPARSASPARCQAWLRATRHLASPRVSAAALPTHQSWGLCPVAAGVNRAHYAPQRTVGDYWGGCHWHLVGRDLLNTL